MAHNMLLCLLQKFPQGGQSFKPVQNAECVNNNLTTTPNLPFVKSKMQGSG